MVNSYLSIQFTNFLVLINIFEDISSEITYFQWDEQWLANLWSLLSLEKRKHFADIYNR